MARSPEAYAADLCVGGTTFATREKIATAFSYDRRCCGYSRRLTWAGGPGHCGRPCRGPPASCGLGSTVFSYGLQEARGGDEKQAPGRRAAEVEQPVVVARRAADEHVLEH